MYIYIHAMTLVQEDQLSKAAYIPQPCVCVYTLRPFEFHREAFVRDLCLSRAVGILEREMPIRRERKTRCVCYMGISKSKKKLTLIISAAISIYG